MDINYYDHPERLASLIEELHSIAFSYYFFRNYFYAKKSIKDNLGLRIHNFETLGSVKILYSEDDKSNKVIDFYEEYKKYLKQYTSFGSDSKDVDAFCKHMFFVEKNPIMKNIFIFNYVVILSNMIQFVKKGNILGMIKNKYYCIFSDKSHGYIDFNSALKVVIGVNEEFLKIKSKRDLRKIKIWRK